MRDTRIRDFKEVLSSTACNYAKNCYWYADSATLYNYIGFQAL